MIISQAYPRTRFESVVPVDLNQREERERLSQSALKVFFKLSQA